MIKQQSHKNVHLRSALWWHRLTFILGVMVLVTFLGAQVVPEREAAPSKDLNSGQLSRVLKVQNPRLSGADVRLVQQKLRDLGYTEVGEVDGFWGPASMTALQRFQRVNGIYPWGEFGDKSQMALFSPTAIKAPGAVTAASTPPVLLASYSWLLGGRSARGAWLNQNDVASTLPAELTFTQIKSKDFPNVAANKVKATVVAAGPEDGEWIDVFGRWVNYLYPVPAEAKPDASLPEGAVLVIAPHNVQPRPITFDPRVNTVQTALQSFIRPRLIDVSIAAVGFTSAVSADLDKDGDLDYVIVARSEVPAEEDFANLGYYSGVFVARAQGNGFTFEVVQETSLGKFTGGEDETYGRYIDLASTWGIQTLLDANGDGTYELLLDEAGWEYGGSTLYFFDGKTWTSVLSEGVGA